jgi:hypothetical protein
MLAALGVAAPLRGGSPARFREPTLLAAAGSCRELLKKLPGLSMAAAASAALLPPAAVGVAKPEPDRGELRADVKPRKAPPAEPNSCRESAAIAKLTGLQGVKLKDCCLCTHDRSRKQINKADMQHYQHALLHAFFTALAAAVLAIYNNLVPYTHRNLPSVQNAAQALRQALHLVRGKELTILIKQALSWHSPR